MLFKLPNLVLALISSILLSLGWLSPFNVLLFVAFVPLFIIEDKLALPQFKSKSLQLLGVTFLVFFGWNLCVTWWIYFASLEGAVMAIVCNSLLMTATFFIWRNLKIRINKPWAVWLFIPIWLGFEYGHTLWDLTWTWLTLGNSFAFTTNLIQWYELTGTSGGSLWILVLNILIFNFIKQRHSIKSKKIIAIVSVIAIPIIISFAILLYRKNNVTTNPSYKTVVIQPNIDPYNEKFYFEPEVQLHNIKQQIETSVDSSTKYLVLPETFLTENIFEGNENASYSIQFIQDSILDAYPNLTIITGANTIYTYQQNEQPSITARKYSDADMYFDSYNTALQINKQGIKFYHKSKLVPGVEKMPFPFLFKHIEQFAIDLGGTSGSLGTQDERTVFYSNNTTVGIAPVICYESVYPDYVGDYIRNGANIIFIITNDGWWENTPGHKQHLAYAKLRAIETRKEIVRCANTGISCFITSLGEIEQATKYWEKAIISKQVSTTNTKTLFVKFGDVISYLSSIIAILLVIWSQILRFKKSQKLVNSHS